MKTGGSQVTHGTNQYNWVKLTLDDALLVLSGGYFVKPAGSFDVFFLFFFRKTEMGGGCYYSEKFL